jgi:uncharacterized protein (TIGR00251 family)
MDNLLSVRVIPRANRNQVYAILEDGTFKIRINAPPSNGKANKALIKYLSDVLDISRSNIRIASGEKAREKKIEIIGYKIEQIKTELLKILESPM